MKFFARPSGYNLVLIRARYQYTQFGDRNYIEGKKAVFDNHEFETDDPETIDLMLKHPRYGIMFWSLDSAMEAPVISKEGEKFIAGEEAAKDSSQLTCPHCSFRAVSASGLRLHLLAKHKAA